MKKLLFLLFFVPLFSCSSSEQREKAHLDSVIQQGKKSLEDFDIQRRADSKTKDIITASMFDSFGVSNGPVKILSAKLIKQEYSNLKNIRLSWKNISSKKIEGIRFRWYGLNAFGEPADMGSYSPYGKGFGSGFTDESLLPGKISYGSWNILSNDGKKVSAAWPYEVVFEDGTTWKSHSR